MFLVIVLFLLFACADGRVVLYPMANDRRREMASSWLARLSSHRTLHQDRFGVLKRRERPHCRSNPDGFDAEVCPILVYSFATARPF